MISISSLSRYYKLVCRRVVMNKVIVKCNRGSKNPENQFIRFSGFLIFPQKKTDKIDLFLTKRESLYPI
ncbi:MAG: hypothetical protein DUD35_03900 [Lactobacillus sp.]|nr:hypothetical protein [Lentilactobacillus hilgardii]RRG11998.1 MAG: hypothetical protein DUD35_03900 [Lactobacillus sp.]